MAIAKDGGVLAHESDEELQRFIEDPYFVHYVGMLLPPRPGVADCFELLEHTHFKPGTSRNDLFHMRIIKWMDIVWGIVSIPVGDKGLMERVALANGLKPAIGVPFVLDGKGGHQFPAANERVFTLQNTPGHPVYRSH